MGKVTPECIYHNYEQVVLVYLIVSIFIKKTYFICKNNHGNSTFVCFQIT